MHDEVTMRSQSRAIINHQLFIDVLGSYHQPPLPMNRDKPVSVEPPSQAASLILPTAYCTVSEQYNCL